MNKIILSWILFSVVNTTCSQNINWHWGRCGASFGSTSAYSEGWAVALDNAENFYLTGFYDYELCLGTDTFNAPEDIRMYVVKYDSSGNFRWAKSSTSLGEPGTGATGYSIATDPFGNIYIDGGHTGPAIYFDSLKVDSTGNSNIFLVKYDSTGKVLWVGGPIAEAEAGNNGLSIDAWGNVYITGWFHSPFISFGGHALTRVGIYNLFIVKYDPSGNVIWAKSEGKGSDIAYATNVTTDPLGNIYVVGWFQSPTMSIGNTTLINAGRDNAFIAKYDSAGNFRWAKSAGGTLYDEGIAVATNTANCVYFTGNFASPEIILGSDTLANRGTNNVFVAKYDSSGNIIWAKPSRDLGSMFVYNIIVDHDGDPYISGGQQGNSNSDPIQFGNLSLPIPANSTDPMYFVKFDCMGNTLCGGVLPTGGDDNNGIAAGSSNNIYIGGDIADTLITGKDTLNNYNSEVAFVAKLNFTCAAHGPNCSGDLGVDLLDFTVTPINNSVHLQWQTASETNSSYFSIEKSADGINFSSIGTVNAAGNSSTLKQYSFTDNTPFYINYYRLKEVDLDGKLTYSNILLVKIAGTNSFTILQNPVQNNLQLQVNAAQSQTNNLSIFDITGRRWKTFTAQNGLQNVDVSLLPSGTYFIKMTASNGQSFEKMFVKAK
jgi:hypothetical protein